MPKPTLKEALAKTAKLEKAPENFLAIKIEGQIVLPYRDGVTLMTALANAELLNDHWSNKAAITPLGNDTVAGTLMSAEQYRQRKIAALMGVSLYDLEKAMREAADAEANQQQP